MNRAYKLVWNAVSNSWVVASELAKSGKKSSVKALKLALVAAAAVASAGAFAVAPPAAGQLPVGELGVSGTVTFDRSVTNQLTMNQTSASTMTIWDSFDVGKNAKVIINQPNSSSVSFNTVLNPTAVTQIFGQVQSNGQFILTNPSGIIFGAGSQVSASSIVAASQLWSSGADAYWQFNKVSNTGRAPASIENYGSLTATGGNVTLLSPNIINQGTISATGGNVNLLFADDVSISNATPYIVTPSTTQSLIQSSGSITATQVSSVGGKILLTGDTSQSSSQIQLAGTLDATTNTNVNGRSVVVDGDLNVNGTSNALDFTTTDGYRLTNGAAVNLNGASIGFSVNGTAYTVIRDVNQLQAMNSNLAGKYVLAANIDASDTVNWNSGAGFVPVGTSSSSFSGVLDGLGHVVNGLSINWPTTNYVGLIGYAVHSLIQNIGVNGSVTGKYAVGGLVGYDQNSNLTNSYASGSVSGEVTVGGLVGYNQNSSVTNSYASGSVSSISYAGGLVGYNDSSSVTNSYASGSVISSNGPFIGGLLGVNFGSTVTNSYASGSVSGSQSVGGLVGYNQNSSVTNSYANGSVSGEVSVGGLVGSNSNGSTVTNSYWDTDSTGQASAAGANVSTLSNVIGLTSSQMKNLSSFSNWGSSIDAQGASGSVWRIYEGYSGPLLRTFLKPLNISANNVTKTYDATSYSVSTPGYSADAAYDSSKLLGTATLAGSALNARNAGTYNIDINGLYSAQNGYDLSVSSGTLTINKRLLTITAQADSKEYDGKLTSSGKPVVVGRQRGDAIVGLTQSYLDKNVGMGKAINVNAGFTIRDGNNGNNYDVVIVNSNAGEITPKDLIISPISNTKVYDGGVTSANKPVVTGLVAGDRITGLFQQYDTKAVGIDKKIIVKPGFVISDGNGGFNYTLIEQSTRDGVITAN